jgi:hypothetical protein
MVNDCVLPEGKLMLRGDVDRRVGARILSKT